MPYANVTRTAQTGPLPQGMWSSQGGAFVQTPQANATVQNQLNDLTASDSRYIGQARNSAAAEAAARGLGNSSYAAGNAEAAAIRAALPIATADAGMFAQAALANQEALNRQQLADQQNQTSIATANIGAGASMYGSDRSYDASRYAQDQQTLRQGQQNTFDAGQADINRQFQQNLLAQQNYYGAQDWARNLWGNIVQGAYGTMYSNPDYFSQPEAAMGFINGFGNFAGNQVNQFLYGNDTGGAP